MKKASIIILTYNQLEYTKMCIDSIRRFTKPIYEIIIVDNASTDGTVEWLKEQPDIITIFNETNRGFPAGCNQGILKSSGDIVVLLNNDTIVTPRWLDNLIICLESSDKIGIVGPATNFTGCFQIVSASYNNFDEMIIFADKFNVSNISLWEERLKLSGFCLAVKKIVINKIGLLDERFFPGYAEDDDYSFRIRQAGYKLMFCKDTFIYHHGNISIKDNPNKYSILEESLEKFKNKHGFNSLHKFTIRIDLIDMLNQADAFRKIRVLEIGCGCGGTLLKIKHLFPQAELFGIEINENAARLARDFADIQVCDVEKTDIGYPHSFFDYILLPDVLEHLKNPWEFLVKLKKYLKPTGQLIACIHNAMHFSIIGSLLKGKWNYTELGILDKNHIRFFTVDTIKDLFEKSGYMITNLNGIITPFNLNGITSFFYDNDQNEKILLKYLEIAVPPDKKADLSVFYYLIKAKV